MKFKLGDITRIRTGKLNANASSENGKYPFFTCSVETLKIDSYSYDCECVLVAGNGDLNVKYYKGKFDAYQRTYIIEDNSRGKLYIEELRKQAIGGVIKYIKLENLTEAIIDLPTIKVQKELVNIFEKIEKIVNYKEFQIQEYDQLIKSRFVEMFDSFNKCKLSEVADITMGQSPKSSTYNEQGIGIPFYQGRTEFTNKYIQTRLYCSKPRKIAMPGDVLLTVRAPVGSVNITKDKACIGRGLASIRGKKGLALNEFLFYTLKSIEKEIASQGQGSTFKAINKQQLHNVKIPKVDIELQKQFTVLTEHIDKLKFGSYKLFKYVIQY